MSSSRWWNRKPTRTRWRSYSLKTAYPSRTWANVNLRPRRASQTWGKFNRKLIWPPSKIPLMHWKVLMASRSKRPFRSPTMAIWAANSMQLATRRFCLFISTMLRAARTLPSTVSEFFMRLHHRSCDELLTALFADELMSKLYNSLASERENVIAIYTARHPSFVSCRAEADRWLQLTIFFSPQRFTPNRLSARHVTRVQRLKAMKKRLCRLSRRTLDCSLLSAASPSKSAPPIPSSFPEKTWSWLLMRPAHKPNQWKSIWRAASTISEWKLN